VSLSVAARRTTELGGRMESFRAPESFVGSASAKPSAKKLSESFESLISEFSIVKI
jgi:hypothetical protein